MALGVLTWTAEVAANISGRRDTVTLECTQKPPLEDVLVKLTHTIWAYFILYLFSCKRILASHIADCMTILSIILNKSMVYFTTIVSLV